MYNLYVTEWASNGTNDLLICNDEYEIVHCIPEATFGIDVCKPGNQAMLFYGDYIDSMPDATDEVQYDTTMHTRLKQIDYTTLLKRIACSPLDADGESILEQLKKYGIGE